jgi:hypothetical protein
LRRFTNGPVEDAKPYIEESDDDDDEGLQVMFAAVHYMYQIWSMRTRTPSDRNANSRFGTVLQTEQKDAQHALGAAACFGSGACGTSARRRAGSRHLPGNS